MNREQIEAIAEDVLAQHLGDIKTLQDLQTILQRTNVNMLPPGEASAAVHNAKLIQSMVISHTNLAKALGGLAEAAERLQLRIGELEKASVTMQEAIINLQVRVRTLEGQGGNADVG